MPEFESVFHQVAVVLAVCTVIGLVASLLGQSPIIGFVLAGILVGPEVFGLVEDPQDIELLSKVGVSLLLFVVGLKLDIGLVRAVGPVAVVTGVVQMTATAALGYLIAISFGMDPVPALYVAIALAFSSTIVVVKLLSDMREIDDLHGRAAIGILIVQDIAVVLVLVILGAFGQEGEGGLAGELAFVAVRTLAFLGLLASAMRWVLPRLLHLLAHRPELLILFATTWAIALAAGGDVIGLGEEVGAFLAGVALASTPYREAIAGRLASLRDFLVLFFFIDLGISLDLGGAGEQLVAALALSVFVLLAKPLIVMAVMGRMRYRKRVSFLTGLSLAQISEFSLITMALGVGLGHIGEDTVALITTVGLATIGFSTYLIYNSHPLYERVAPVLDVFEREGAPGDRIDTAHPAAPAVVVIGLGRFGNALVRQLRERDVDVLGVDFDPQALQVSEGQGIPTMYGDAEDPELAGALPLAGVQWVVCTVRRRDANLALVHGLRHHGYEGRIALSTESEREISALEKAGAEVVFRPFITAAKQAADLLRGPLD